MSTLALLAVISAFPLAPQERATSLAVPRGAPVVRPRPAIRGGAARVASMTASQVQAAVQKFKPVKLVQPYAQFSARRLYIADRGYVFVSYPSAVYADHDIMYWINPRQYSGISISLDDTVPNKLYVATLNVLVEGSGQMRVRSNGGTSYINVNASTQHIPIALTDDEDSIWASIEFQNSPAFFRIDSIDIFKTE